MTKKITCIIASLLAVVFLFAGCSAEQIKSILIPEIDTYDPAVELASDMLGKEITQENLTSGDFTYLILDDDTAVVTKYNGKDDIVEIPESLDGHKVAGLENKALYQSEIKELILPDTLEVVGNYAAMHCTELERVTFGKGIKIIGVSAFESNGNNSNATGDGSLKTIVFNGSPEKISQKAFYFADKLTEIIIPDGVKYIENWAFAKCYGAEKIIIGEGVEYIGDHAFLKCKKAKEIFIPGTCKTVETSAFYQCTGIEKLTLETGVETLMKGAFEECSSIKEVIIPETVKTMEPYVFYNCDSLNLCTFEGSPEIMEKDIFTGADNITVKTSVGSSAEKYAADNNIPVLKQG